MLTIDQDRFPYLSACCFPFGLVFSLGTKCEAFSLIFLISEVRSKAFQAVEQFLQILKHNYEKVEIMALPNTCLEIFVIIYRVLLTFVDFLNRQTLERQEPLEELQLYLKLLV